MKLLDRTAENSIEGQQTTATDGLPTNSDCIEQELKRNAPVQPADQADVDSDSAQHGVAAGRRRLRLSETLQPLKMKYVADRAKARQHTTTRRQKESQRWESNPRPAVYETAALPLSYVGPVSVSSASSSIWETSQWLMSSRRMLSAMSVARRFLSSSPIVIAWYMACIVPSISAGETVSAPCFNCWMRAGGL